MAGINHLDLAGPGRLLGSEDLLLPASLPVDGNALGAELPSEAVGAIDIRDRRRVSEVDGLGDGIVDESLQYGLHPHVLRRCDVESDNEDPLDLSRYFVNPLARSLSFGHLLLDPPDGLLVEAGLDQRLLKELREIDQFDVLALLHHRSGVG